ncbi:MAG: glycosyltransferase [Anaerolineae bacterium]|nr:glycosyltransferase [Anaerolineae bacterium]
MRLLFLSQVLPYPLDAGPKMRSYFVLRHLVQHHEVTLVTFVRETDKAEYISHLADLCHAVHTVPMPRTPIREARFLLKSIITQEPFLITRDYVAAMMEKLRALTNSQTFDAVHADQLWMAEYALAVKKMQPSTKIILDQHNAVQLIPQRLAENETNAIKKIILAREARLLARYEPKVCQQFDHVVWVTQEDYQAVNGHSGSTNGHLPSTVIPICADPVQVEPIPVTENRHRITFLGGLHWPPNAEGILWFAKHVFPQVKAAIPEAILTVIGKNPPAGLEGDGVEVTGYVIDPKPYLAETAAFIVPLYAGGGMRVKILDAWSWGLPIISTTIGAEGIQTAHGKDILIADTPDEFAQAVIRVCRDPELAQQLAKNGRQSVIEKYNWQTIYAAWDKVYIQAHQKNGIHPQQVTM